jgi:hypothetical protein
MSCLIVRMRTALPGDFNQFNVGCAQLLNGDAKALRDIRRSYGGKCLPAILGYLSVHFGQANGQLSEHLWICDWHVTRDARYLFETRHHSCLN